MEEDDEENEMLSEENEMVNGGYDKCRFVGDIDPGRSAGISMECPICAGQCAPQLLLAQGSELGRFAHQQL